MNRPWAATLYERYVQLYGDPIEQPMRPHPAESDEDPQRAIPVNKNSTG